MKKMLFPWMLAVAMLTGAIFAGLQLKAQQVSSAGFIPPQHLAREAMSDTDVAAVQNRQSELLRAARIYGYNLEQGNWAYEQTICPAMPTTILLHYLQQFPDGTSSLFTVVMPRKAGRVRIVPVLYRNASPFLPPAKNPRNYVLFNKLVSPSIASKDIASSNRSLELGVCYAELAGGRTNIPSGSGIKVSIAGAPLATIRLNPQDHTKHTTFASLQGDTTYRLWNVSFNKDGRIVAADSEDLTVYSPKSPHQQPSAVATASRPEQASRAPGPIQTRPVSGKQGGVNSGITADQKIQPVQTFAITGGQGSEQDPYEPGWKVIMHSAEPAARLIPQAPPPPEKMRPAPPAPEAQNDQEERVTK